MQHGAIRMGKRSLVANWLPRSVAGKQHNTLQAVAGRVSSCLTATPLESLRHEPIGWELFYNFAELVSLGRRLAQNTRLCTGVSAHTSKRAPHPDQRAPDCGGGGGAVSAWRKRKGPLAYRPRLLRRASRAPRWSLERVEAVLD